MRRGWMAAVIGLAMLGAGAVRAQAPGLDQAVAAERRGDHAAALAAFRQLAQADDAEAAYWVGAIYEKGEGVPQDLGLAARWYARAAERGFPAAQFRLGLLLDAGAGVPADRAAALRQYLAAARQGHLAAMRAIAMAYESGQGVEPNPRTAFSWYRRAADYGDNESFNRARRMAITMTSDAGLAPVDAAFAEFQRGNQMRALGSLISAADGGDADAKAWLGFFYENGIAGPKDFAKATRNYAESAAGGSLKGKTDFATALLFGAGTTHDPDRARRLLTEAAVAGFALAQFNLAYLDEQQAHGGGSGLEDARRWYRRAGLLGYPPAWAELDRMLGLSQPASRPAAQPTAAPAAGPAPTAAAAAAVAPAAAADPLPQ